MRMLEPARICGAGWIGADGLGSLGVSRFRPGPGPLPRVRWEEASSTPNPRFGRLDAFSRAGLLAAARALHDAGMALADRRKRPAGIIASTHLGCLGADLAYYDTAIPAGGALASPNRFAYTLPSSFLGEVALTFGLTGPGFVIGLPGGGAEHDPLAALGVAADWLAAGEDSFMLAGFCDVPPQELAGCGISAAAGFVVLEPSGGNGGPQLARGEHGTWSVGGEPVGSWQEVFDTLASIRSDRGMRRRS